MRYFLTCPEYNLGMTQISGKPGASWSTEAKQAGNTGKAESTPKAGKSNQPKVAAKPKGVPRRQNLLLTKLSQSLKLKRMAGRKARRRGRRKRKNRRPAPQQQTMAAES